MQKDHKDELSPAIELREVGKYKEAQEWLRNIIEHDSQNSEALSLLSQVLLLDKKEVEAEEGAHGSRIYQPKTSICLSQSSKVIIEAV